MGVRCCTLRAVEIRGIMDGKEADIITLNDASNNKTAGKLLHQGFAVPDPKSF